MNTFKQGQTVRLTVTFRNFANTLADPTTVTFWVQKELDEAWATYQSPDVVHESTGVYHLDVSTSTEGGLYDWRVVGSGTTPSANQGQFYVEPMIPSDVAP